MLWLVPLSFLIILGVTFFIYKMINKQKAQKKIETSNRYDNYMKLVNKTISRAHTIEPYEKQKARRERMRKLQEKHQTTTSWYHEKMERKSSFNRHLRH